MYDHPPAGAAVRCNSSMQDAQPPSECQNAYNELQAVQASLAGQLEYLRSRLAPVLCDREEQKTGGGAVTTRAPYSEIHGQFVAGIYRTNDMTAVVNDMLERLTV